MPAVRLPGWPLILALLVLVASMPQASAATEDVRLDAEIVLDDADTMRLVVTVTEGAMHYSPWSFLLPDDMTFTEARDASGTLSASVENDRVRVESRGRGASYWLQVTFTGAPVAHGPFLRLPADVSAPSDVPTTVRAILPEDWRLVGWRQSTLEPDASGIFEKVGPIFAEYLALPADVPFEAADARVAGDVTLREANATVGASGMDVTARLTYDTTVYGADWTFLLPENATLVEARGPFGALGADVAGERVEVVAPYPFDFHLGARWIEVTWRLPAPEIYGGGFERAWLSVPSGDDTRTTLDVTLQDGYTLLGVDERGAVRTGPLAFATDGPLGVKLALSPPLAADEVEFETEAFVVRAPADLASAARLTTEEAQRHLASALGFVGGAAIDRPFHVRFTRADVFDWETGFYTRGLNTISIDAKVLQNTTDSADVGAVATLLHETTHGLIDRLFPDSDLDLSLFDEGLSRLAEIHLELAKPDEVVDCESTGNGGQSCVIRSSRPDSEDVASFYAGGQTFPVGWSTDTVDDATRGFLYDYSGMIFHAYESRAPAPALANALTRLAADGLPEDPATAAEAIVSTLLSESPSLTRDTLLHPGRGMEHQSQFRACMGALVEPSVPWEDIPPQGDCFAFRYDADAVLAAREVAGPTPDTGFGTLPPPTAPTGDGATWTPASPPRVSPTLDAPSSGGSGGGSAVGADTGADGGVAPVPNAGWLALAGAGIAVALSARRR